MSTQKVIVRKSGHQKARKRQLTSLEIRAFRNNPSVRKFYKILDMYGLRKKALSRITRHLESQEGVAKYEDL